MDDINLPSSIVALKVRLAAAHDSVSLEVVKVTSTTNWRAVVDPASDSDTDQTDRQSELAATTTGCTSNDSSVL